jgi:YfiH family protein
VIEQQRGTSRVIQRRESSGVSYLQFEHFLEVPDLVHGVFTRRGGHSREPFTGLNVSVSSGDAFEDVIRNRRLTLRTLGLEGYPCATLWQVHGAGVAVFQREGWDDWRGDWGHRSYTLDGHELIWTSRPRLKADALITRERGVALTMSFGDCTPLLFYDPVHEAIGLAHAGWRGTARGIALTTVEALSKAFGSRPEQIFVAIAPAIGPCCYEVSEIVRGLFTGELDFPEMPTDPRLRNPIRHSAVFSMLPAGDRRGRPDRPSLRLDLQETNYYQLRMAGLLPEHIEVARVCTSCERAHYFSHRGEQGRTGRFPVVMALRDAAEREEERAS